MPERFKSITVRLLSLLPTALLLLGYGFLPASIKETPGVVQYPVLLVASWYGGMACGIISTTACTVFTLLRVRPQVLVSPFANIPSLNRVSMLLITGVAFAYLLGILQNALKEKANAVSIRDEFISLASHELKTPLTSLKLKNDLFLRLLKKNPSTPITATQALAHAEYCDRQIARLQSLISNMLDVSTLSRKDVTLELSQLELSSFAQSIADDFKTVAAASGSELTVHAPDPIHSTCDRHRIEQVISNILGNAIKYGMGNPIRLEVIREGNRAFISVQDQGMGISHADQERIFGRYERAVPSAGIQGLGLGLYLSRAIVKLHGGDITVQSTPGKGSRFTVSLPVS